jgi:hypothetical protein
MAALSLPAGQAAYRRRQQLESVFYLPFTDRPKPLLDLGFGCLVCTESALFCTVFGQNSSARPPMHISDKCKYLARQSDAASSGDMPR